MNFEPSYAALLSIFIPIIAGVSSHLLAKIPKNGAILAKAFCIFTSYITFLLVFLLTIAVSQKPIEAQLFIISLQSGMINIGLYVDLLALVPALLSSLFTALALTYNIRYLSPYNRAYEVGWEFNRSYSFILLFNGAMLGTLFSSNLFSLIIFWELVSVCSYALISFWNEDQFCLRASIKCFIMTHIGSIAILLATIVIYFTTGTSDIAEIGKRISPGDPVISIVLPLFLVSVLPKTVLFPFHTWLPDGTVAPTSATVLFHVCGFQSGIYIIIRFFLDVFYLHVISSTAMPFPLIFGNVSIWSFILCAIGAITVIVGALNGIVESDFKRIVAYSTISQLGYIVMAAGLSTPLGISASLFHMISHALYCGLLFLCAGAIIYRTGKHDINEIGGLYDYMPITAFCCLIGILSLSTIPLLSDFASKYLILHATVDAGATLFTIVAFVGCVLNSAIAIRLFHSIFMERTAKMMIGVEFEDPPICMLIPMILASISLVIFGVLPIIPLNLLVSPAVKQIRFTVDVTEQLWLIKTAYGSWSPIVVVVSFLALSTVFIYARSRSRKVAIAYRKTVSEETLKPFLCGEDSNLLNGPRGYHFYHTLTHVLRVEWLCNASNVDRIYNSLSRKFKSFCERFLFLDIEQRYFEAILSFMAGAIVVIMIAILFGG